MTRRGTHPVSWLARKLDVPVGRTGVDPVDSARQFALWKCRAAATRVLRHHLQLTAALQQTGCGVTKEKRKQRVIVSLTSFPPRIDTVWLSIETLLRQTARPDEVILWLADEEFPDGLDDLPDRLLSQRNRGLTIRFCDNLKSHKKYYHALQMNPADLVITVDDDVFYPEDTIEKLLRLHARYPQCICCTRARRIAVNDDGSVRPYSAWKVVNSKTTPSKYLCPTGVGGVLYPPNALDEEVFDREAFANLCPHADDLWLKAMSLRRGTEVAVTENGVDAMLAIPGGQEEPLSDINKQERANDRQFANLLDHYDLPIG